MNTQADLRSEMARHQETKARLAESVERIATLEAENAAMREELARAASRESDLCGQLSDLRDQFGTLDDYATCRAVHNSALTEQVTTLQTRCTGLLELTRERDVDAHVRQLYRGFQQDIPETPCISPVLGFRVGLVREEFEELMFACGYEQPTCDVGSSGVAMLDWKQTGKPDLVAIVDACIDIVVVTIGMLVACGVRFWPMWWAVHRSNVAKFGGPRREDGKQMKPANWQPPDIAGELRKQGWQG